MNKPSETLKDRLRIALSKRNITQQDLSDKTGIPKSSISQYISGYAKPKDDRIYAISVALNINEAWLLGYDVPMERSPVYDFDNVVDQCVMEPLSPYQYKTDSYKIPILGEIVAGMPIDAYENVLGYEDITLDMAAKGEHYALKVKGSSMEPRICDGDIVIVRVQPDVESGDIAVVFVNGNEATMKKVLKHDNGITLVALNPIVYEPHFYTYEEVENLPITISGKVIELRASF